MEARSVFGRRKRAKEPVAAPGADPADDAFVDDLDPEDRAYEDALFLAELDDQDKAPVLQRPQGPWDAADAPADDRPRLDLGGMLVPVPPDTEVRVDVSPEGEVVAATLVRGNGAVQVNAFAAPRTEGIWAEVLDEIAASLAETGGVTERATGPHGPELRTAVPTQAPDGSILMAPARFVGVDGPRWFLRAMYTGSAAVDPDAAAPLEAALRDVVVVRGTDPMAVRDPLPLRLPAQAQEAAAAAQAAGPATAEQDVDDPEASGDPLALPERGPEITETR